MTTPAPLAAHLKRDLSDLCLRKAVRNSLSIMGEINMRIRPHKLRHRRRRPAAGQISRSAFWRPIHNRVNSIFPAPDVGYDSLRMNCVVTAGPTYESLDDVRRLTNFSTGRLGTELAGFLADRGHHVTLLIGEQATFRGEPRAQTLQAFTTTADLLERLKTLSRQTVDAVFHAAAVSDYTFGRIWVRSASGEMVEVRSGKISTRDGPLLAELIPTPKIIAQLRGWYPGARAPGSAHQEGSVRDGAASHASHPGRGPPPTEENYRNRPRAA